MNIHSSLKTFVTRYRTQVLIEGVIKTFKKGKRGKKLEKVSFVPLLGLCLDFALLH
jgi:hypothetical protein